MQGLVSLLPLVGIALLFWILIVRPAARRQKDLARMQSSLEVGDQVVLTSGFYGTLRAILDDRIEVDLAPDVTVTVARGAVGSVVAAEDPAELDEADDPPDLQSTDTEDD